MENYRKYLESQLEELDQLLKIAEKRTKKNESLPDEHVRVSSGRGHYQYYTVDKDYKNRKYVTVKKIKYIKDLVQRDYDNEITKTINVLKNKLEQFLKEYDIQKIIDIYNSLPSGKKCLVSPVIKNDEQFVEEWRAEHPGGQNPYPEEGIYQTNNGENVRSKTEKIIADTLEKYGIPYVYEPLIELNGFQDVYPDFLVLNVRTRKQYIWEHLGLVSDSDYATNNFVKLQKYENSGYIFERDMIITMESAQMPIKIKLIEEKIKECLL